jgi:hypothetical protein
VSGNPSKLRVRHYDGVYYFLGELLQSLKLDEVKRLLLDSGFDYTENCGSLFLKTHSLEVPEDEEFFDGETDSCEESTENDLEWTGAEISLDYQRSACEKLIAAGKIDRNLIWDLWMIRKGWLPRDLVASQYIEIMGTGADSDDQIETLMEMLAEFKSTDSTIGWAVAKIHATGSNHFVDSDELGIFDHMIESIRANPLSENLSELDYVIIEGLLKRKKRILSQQSTAEAQRIKGSFEPDEYGPDAAAEARYAFSLSKHLSKRNRYVFSIGAAEQFEVTNFDLLDSHLMHLLGMEFD